MLLFIGYMEVLKRTQPPAKDQNEVVAEQDENGNPLPVPVDGENDAADEAQQLAEADPDPEQDETQVLEQAAPTPAELKRYTIGSVDPADGYPMLVTFNSMGAAVERVELCDR